MRKVFGVFTIIIFVLVAYSIFRLRVAETVLSAFSPNYADITTSHMKSLNHEQLVTLASSAVSKNNELVIVANANFSEFEATVLLLSATLMALLLVAWFMIYKGYNKPLKRDLGDASRPEAP